MEELELSSRFSSKTDASLATCVGCLPPFLFLGLFNGFQFPMQSNASEVHSGRVCACVYIHICGYIKSSACSKSWQQLKRERVEPQVQHWHPKSHGMKMKSSRSNGKW